MSDKLFRATHRFARITARKARFVMDLVRGRSVNDALNTLHFVHRRASPMIQKVIRSALANAGQDLDVDVNRLYITEARVDEGPLLGGRARWRPRAQGRAYPILKKTCHIAVILAEAPEAPEAPDARRPRKNATAEAVEVPSEADVAATESEES